MRQVADLAGVSEATVSRVINNRPGIAASTRERVRSALDQLAYLRPRTDRSPVVPLVGLIVPELSNPIFPRFAQAIERGLALRGRTMVLCTDTFLTGWEPAYLETLVDRQVEAVVIVSGLHADPDVSHDHYGQLIRRDVRVVVVNGRTDDLADIPAISADDRGAAAAAVAHLAELGHHRIGFASGQWTLLPSARKLKGYREAVRRVGASGDPSLAVETLFTFEGGETAIRALLDVGATAVICGNDLIALGVVRGARKLGVDVPRDLSVVGFDDGGFCNFTDPPLTTVRQPVEAMSDAAINVLLGRRTRPTRELLFDTDLIVRQSTGRAPPQA